MRQRKSHLVVPLASSKPGIDQASQRHLYRHPKEKHHGITVATAADSLKVVKRAEELGLQRLVL